MMSNVSNLRGKYLHHKGKYYDVLGEAREVTTHTTYIIYRQDYGHKHWWIRPKEMFLEKIERNGHAILRFNRIDNTLDIPEVIPKTFPVTHTETGERYLAKYIKDFYGQYFLNLENQYGEQLCLEWLDQNMQGAASYENL